MATDVTTSDPSPELPRPSAGVELRENGVAQQRGVDELLRLLARTDVRPHQIVSLYLDARWRDEQQRERVSTTLRDRVRKLRAKPQLSPGLDADLDVALAFVEEHVRQRADVGWPGLALFRCGEARFELFLRSRASFPTLLAVGPHPLVRPLLLLPEQDRALVVLTDRESVRIHRVALGQLSEEDEVSFELPHRERKAEWTDIGSSRHRHHQLDQLHREAAKSIARLFDNDRPQRILVGGRTEAVANLMRLLPERLRAHAIPSDDLALGGADHELLASVERTLGEASLADEQERFVEIDTLAQSGGRGAVGLSAVVAALNLGRPYRILLAEDLRRTLRQCDLCGVFSLDTNGECLGCGGPTLASDALEAISRSALRIGARVDVVTSGLLDDHGGAAALLRY